MGEKNILLLSCRSPFMDNDKVYPPLANLYLHSAIKEYLPSAKVTITDEYNNKSVDWFKQFTHIGVSVMTPQRNEANNLFYFLRNNTDAKLIVGGPHVKHYFDEVNKQDWDYIVPNDGERAILWALAGTELKVLNDKLKGDNFKFWSRKPNRLDNAEFLKTFNYNLDGNNSTTLMTARGCPEACGFCEDAKTLVRRTPIETLKRELDDIVSLDYKGVYIFDDIFALSQKIATPIAEELLKRNLKYRCNGQAKYFSFDFAQMLYNTGCVEIAFGAESGSQKILDNVNKGTTVEQNYEFINSCVDSNIKVKAFIMLGLPGENEQTINETEEFIKTSGLDDFQLCIYYPYKGTEIRKQMEIGGLIDLEFEGEGLGAYGQKGGNTESRVSTSSLSSQDLLYHRNRLVKLYKPKSHKENWKNDSINNGPEL